MEATEKKIGWRVVITTAGFVIICNTIAFATTSESLRLVVLGTHSIGIGVLFLLAYYHENESIVFRVLIWCCEHFILFSRTMECILLFYIGRDFGHTCNSSGTWGDKHAPREANNRINLTRNRRVRFQAWPIARAGYANR